MFPVMQRASHWNGYLFAAVLAASLIYSIPKAFEFAESEDNVTGLFLDGELARKFEGDFDGDFPLRDLSVTLWSDINFLAFGEGEQGAVLGKDNWLFTAEEFSLPNFPDRAIERHLTTILKAQKALAERNQRLVLIPLPMKAQIYSDYLIHEGDARLSDLYGRFVQRLTKAGVETISLKKAFLEQKNTELLFLQRDTHWTPEGARLAARTIAQALPQLKGESRYETRLVGEDSRRGDLLNFVRISERLVPGLMTDDQLNRYETAPVTSDDTSADLFGEREAPILVVGSSYTEIDAWNFIGFLQEYLQREVVKVAVQARGSEYAMDQYLTEPTPGTETAEVVLWEYPLRELLIYRKVSETWGNLNSLF